jgi:hypothetical protein
LVNERDFPMRYCANVDCPNCGHELGLVAKVCDQCGDPSVDQTPKPLRPPEDNRPEMASILLAQPEGVSPIIVQSTELSRSVDVLEHQTGISQPPGANPPREQTTIQDGLDALIDIKDKYTVGEDCQLIVRTTIPVSQTSRIKLVLCFSSGFPILPGNPWLSPEERLTQGQGNAHFQCRFRFSQPGAHSLRRIYLTLDQGNNESTTIWKSDPLNIEITVDAQSVGHQIIIQAQEINNYGKIVPQIMDDSSRSGGKPVCVRVPLRLSKEAPPAPGGVLPRLAPALRVSRADREHFFATGERVFLGRNTLDQDTDGGSHFAVFPLPLSDPGNAALARRLSRRQIAFRYNFEREAWEISSVGRSESTLNGRILREPAQSIPLGGAHLRMLDGALNLVANLQADGLAISIVRENASEGTRYSAIGGPVGLDASTLEVVPLEEGQLALWSFLGELMVTATNGSTVLFDGRKLRVGEFQRVRTKRSLAVNGTALNVAPATIEDFGDRKPPA